MPATTVYALRYPALSDAPNGPTLGQNLANDVENLGLLVPVCVMTAGAATTLIDGIFTTVLFSTEVIDTHNGHSTVSNTGRYTVPAGWGGYYRMSAHASIVVGAGNSKACRFIKNGAGTIDYTRTDKVVLGPSSVETSTIQLLAPADYIEFQAFQNGAAGNHNTIAANSQFCIEFIRRT